MVSKDHTLTSTLNAITNTNSLAVAALLTQADTLVRISVVLKRRHGDGVMSWIFATQSYGWRMSSKINCKHSAELISHV